MGHTGSKITINCHRSQLRAAHCDFIAAFIWQISKKEYIHIGQFELQDYRKTLFVYRPITDLTCHIYVKYMFVCSHLCFIYVTMSHLCSHLCTILFTSMFSWVSYCSAHVSMILVRMCPKAKQLTSDL